MPKPGDISVCYYCAQMLVYDAACKPAKLAAAEETAILAADAERAELIRSMQAIFRSRRRTH